MGVKLAFYVWQTKTDYTKAIKEDLTTLDKELKDSTTFHIWESEPETKTSFWFDVKQTDTEVTEEPVTFNLNRQTTEELVFNSDENKELNFNSNENKNLTFNNSEKTNDVEELVFNPDENKWELTFNTEEK